MLALMTIDTILGILGIMLGLAGLIAGYIFYRKSIRIKQLLYSLKTDNLIKDNVAQLSGLVITCSGRNVKILSASNIVIWNNGSETIDLLDIVKSNPLRIHAGQEVLILDAKITKASNSSCQLAVNVSADAQYALITFEYLDREQGGIIQLVHTGLSSSDLLVVGDIKGAKLLHRNRGAMPFSDRVIIVSLFTALIFSLLACVLVSKGVISILSFISGGLIFWPCLITITNLVNTYQSSLNALFAPLPSFASDSR
jgi:hypothetical protein